MTLTQQDKAALEIIHTNAREKDLNLIGAKTRRTSSRFCLGVEHGDYNGTELFGVGTDRFIWHTYRPNGTNRIRLYSVNFPDDGIIDFQIGSVPAPQSNQITQTWARFPYGVDYILRQNGYKINQGIDAVLYGNIPGGGMSRSASLTLNLILSLLDANEIEIEDKFKIVDMAQAVENTYIGSPCGILDQTMILFARENMGTHYNPQNRTINYIPLGPSAAQFRIVVMDTGTDRPGLEKSTYKIRRNECDEFAALLKNSGYDISCLADVKDKNTYQRIMAEFQDTKPHLCARLHYIFHAQERFYQMLQSWKIGDMETVGRIFRQDGIGLRDAYQISGPELETMCDIARTVPAVLGERMLGGGDKGAAGALLWADGADQLQQAVRNAYPRSHPQYTDKFAVHLCKIVAGVTVIEET